MRLVKRPNNGISVKFPGGHIPRRDPAADSFVLERLTDGFRRCFVLGKERWAGAIDVVGNHTLVNVCASMRYRGVVAACGLAGGLDFPATVVPFILRGVTLVGVDSVMCPRADRVEAWRRLAQDLDAAKLDLLTEEIGLTQVVDRAAGLLEGRVRGRLVVDTRR